MENQEIPKKLTLEEIEQQEKNLEQNQEIESPNEKDDSLRVSEIDIEISKKEQNIEETKNKIDDIRNNLGLPPSDEIPPSIQVTKKSLEDLNLEKNELRVKQMGELAEKSATLHQEMKDFKKSKAEFTEKDGKRFFTFKSAEDKAEYEKMKFEEEKLDNQYNSLAFEKSNTNNTNQEKSVNNQNQENTEETQRFERNVKTVLEDISSQSKTMLDALYERQQNRLTSIQSNDDFQRMASQIKNLGNFESKINKDSLQEIIDNVRRLKNSFREFRVMQSGGMIRENRDNLDKLSFGAKKFGNSISESSSKLPTEMENKELEEKSRELKTALKMLAEDSQKLWLLAVKMRENSR